MKSWTWVNSQRLAMWKDKNKEYRPKRKVAINRSNGNKGKVPEEVSKKQNHEGM